MKKAKLEWSSSGKRSIQRIYRYLAQYSRAQASHIVRKIRQSMARIQDYPQIGRTVDGMSLEYREYIVSGYLILYRYDGDRVLILGIRSQRETSYYK